MALMQAECAIRQNRPGDLKTTEYYTCVALPTKQKMRYGLQRQTLLKPGFGQNRPLKFPLGRSTPVRSFAGGVLPTEASKGHTTPGRTQPSHDMISYVVGLAPVLLELDKSGAPPAAMQLIVSLHRRSVSPSIRAARLP